MKLIRPASALLVVAVAVACGKVGPPQPPEPRGPLPPRAVQARQVGSAAEVAFTVPEPRGTKPAQEPVRVEIVRVAYPPGPKPPSDPDAFRYRGIVVASLDEDPMAPGARRGLRDSTVGELGNRGERWVVRYGVRVRDRRGRPSSLVLAQDLEIVPPTRAPSGLRAEVAADGIQLRWDASDGTEGAKYNVYRAAREWALLDAPLNTQPVTESQYRDTAVASGQTYLYRVRAVAAEGQPYRESESSEAIAVTAVDRFAPAAPNGLVVVQEGAAIRLFWNPSAERDLAGYRLYRRVADGEWSRIGPDPIKAPLYLDTDIRPDDRITYRVTAVDRAEASNESAPGESVQVVVVKDPVLAPAEPK